VRVTVVVVEVVRLFRLLHHNGLGGVGLQPYVLWLLVDFPESRTQLVPTWSGIFGESVARDGMLPCENA
jgi:hypothetical protein